MIQATPNLSLDPAIVGACLAQNERRSRYWLGLWAELLAAAYLTLAGYRILAWRFKTRSGEVDLVAVKGGIVAFVEVKARRTMDAAEASIGRRQSGRIRRAASAFVARSPNLAGLEQRFDALFLVGGHWPRHLPGAV